MAWTLAWAAAGAAEVWDTKPFLEWSDKELDKVLTDSPWAGKGNLTHARQGAGLGSVPEWKIIVSIRSALPMKQALVRNDVGLRGTLAPQHEQLLATPEEVYVVSISGIPQALVPQLQSVADAAALRRRGKDPIAATQGSAIMVDKDGKLVSQATPQRRPPVQIVPVLQRGGGGAAGRGGGAGRGFGGAPPDNSGITATLILGFPKDNPITAQDQEFELTTVIGTYNVKRTFKLKDMMFKGELAL
jgi:hypothetical protein